MNASFVYEEYEMRTFIDNKSAKNVNYFKSIK